MVKNGTWLKRNSEFFRHFPFLPSSTISVFNVTQNLGHHHRFLDLGYGLSNEILISSDYCTLLEVYYCMLNRDLDIIWHCRMCLWDFPLHLQNPVSLISTCTFQHDCFIVYKNMIFNSADDNSVLVTITSLSQNIIFNQG